LVRALKAVVRSPEKRARFAKYAGLRTTVVEEKRGPVLTKVRFWKVGPLKRAALEKFLPGPE
jgi:hypothetical protein